MSYCRFENTLNDLWDCYDHWEDKEDLSKSEIQAREQILELAKKIVKEYSEEF